MVRTKIQSITRFDMFSMRFIPTILVFLTMMILITSSSRTATRSVAETRDVTISQRARFIEASVMQRLSLYENAVKAGAGLLDSSDMVTRDEWRRFVTSLEMEDRLPAALGLGFTEFVPAAQLPGYLASVRSSGVPDFDIRPKEPVRDIYTVITYIEPSNERNLQALGGDMYTEPERRAAMDKARDSGTSAISNVVPILQEQNERKNGVVFFHPVYQPGVPITTVEERRAAILGFVYSPLRSSTLFGTIVDSADKDLNFRIYLGDINNPDNLLYEQNPNANPTTYLWGQKDTFRSNDQDWTIQYGTRDAIVPEAIRQRPRNIAISGTIFAFIVASAVYLLLQRRTRLLADKEERNLERAKDDLLSLASHQLRTPATGVKQYVGMVLEGFAGDIDAEQRDLLSKAYESNERQLRIINEFLYLAKADANRIIISPQKFDIVELIKQIRRDMQSEISEAGHSVRVKTKSKSVIVVADIHSARMILENLLSNAVKYTPTGGRILITVRNSGHNVFIDVKDNGVGIDKKDFALLFKQFSRIPNELTKYTSGSGIGLYLAIYLAKLNGGTITVKSEKGAGSVFTVRFTSMSVKKLTEPLKRRK